MDLRLFRNRNFATSVGLMFTLGAVLYGTTVLIPLFLQTLMGYSAQSAGEVLSLGGVATMAMMPVVGFLVSRVPAKYLVAPAFAGMSLALVCALFVPLILLLVKRNEPGSAPAGAH